MARAGTLGTREDVSLENPFDLPVVFPFPCSVLFSVSSACWKLGMGTEAFVGGASVGAADDSPLPSVSPLHNQRDPVCGWDGV